MEPGKRALDTPTETKEAGTSRRLKAVLPAERSTRRLRWTPQASHGSAITIKTVQTKAISSMHTKTRVAGIPRRSIRGVWRVKLSSLAVDPSGTPHVVFSGYGRGSLQYAKRNSSGWQETTISSTQDVGQFNTLVLDEFSYPHIAYGDTALRVMKYAYQDANGWHTTVLARPGSQSSGCD